MALPLRKLTIFSLLLALAAWSAVGAHHLYTEKVRPKKEPTPSPQYQTADIRQEVLSSLEEDLEFCGIVKDSIVSDKGKFWLICNGRPFYALYENGKVNYELNGWSFLKDQPEILKELQDNHCRLYQTTDDHQLSFICAEDEKVRKYTFSTADFKLTKQSEELFLNEIFLESWRAKIFPCDLSSTIGVGWEDEFLVELTMSCRDYNTKLYFNFNKMSFTLPVVVDESLSDEEKVQQSVELPHLFFCNLDKVQETEERRFLVSLDCPKTGKLMIDYDLNLGVANFLFNKEEFVDLFFFVGIDIFPFLEDEKVKYLTSRQDDNYSYHYYLAGKQVIVAEGLKEGSISQVYLKDESLK